MDDVVDTSMALVTALTPFTAEAVRGSAINLHATVVTGVGVAKEWSKAKANCNTNGVVVHVQSQR